MALIKCDFFSDVLGLSTSMYAILPQNTQNQIGMTGNTLQKEPPVLYLLHGLSDDCSTWIRRTSIERYVAEKGIAVIMPQVDRSFYTDMVHGNKYWTFISDELPKISRSFFRLSSERDDNFIAGLSMGGYGAFKMALSCTDKFKAAASLSGCLDICSSYRKNQNDSNVIAIEFENIFGDYNYLPGSGNDLFYLMDKIISENKEKPMLYQCCGLEDFLYEENTNFKEYANKLGYDLTYSEEHATHDWAYWDKKIQDVLDWLPIHKIHSN